MPKGIIDIGLMYAFIKRLVTPFTEWDAFKEGVIDEDGKVLISPDKRNIAQRDSYGYYDRVVANLKKIIALVPYGKTRFATFASALLLMREDKLPTNREDLRILVEEYMEEIHNYIPEEIVNTVGNNIGSDTTNDPPKRKKRKKKTVTGERRISDFL